jgi:hypothetical protein
MTVNVVTEGIDPMGITDGPYNGKPNPHAWMSPSNALIYVENIRKARRPNRKFISSPFCVFQASRERTKCNCKLFARRLTDHNAIVKLVANELQLGSSKPEKP